MNIDEICSYRVDCCECPKENNCLFLEKKAKEKAKKKAKKNMTIKDYCFEHMCNMGECLFRRLCPFYMYGGLTPDDMKDEEVNEITNDIIELGKILEGKYDD